MWRKFRTSGYLKSTIVSLVIIALGVGAVAVLDWRDRAAQAQTPPPAERNMQSDGIGGEVQGSFVIEGASVDSEGGEGTIIVRPAEGGEGMVVMRPTEGGMRMNRGGE